MIRCLTLASLCVWAAGEDTGKTELVKLVAELQQQARIQQERIAAYEALVQQRVQASAESRKLSDAVYVYHKPSIYEGEEQELGIERNYLPEEQLEYLMGHVWALLCGALVVFMQAGLAMIEAGNGRVKYVPHTLLKNTTIVTASCLGWWLFGWSFAHTGPYDSFGFKENKFAGREQFAGHTFVSFRKDGQIEPSDAMGRWFYSWAICGLATVIASTGVAERMNFAGAMIFSFLFSSFIHPIVVAWTWGKGFLANMNRTGYVDFAGSGIVFMAGGWAALVGCVISGTRQGRFDGMVGRQRILDWPRSFQPHSMPLVVLGTFILWFGWYGLACGSTLAMHDIEKGMLAAQVAMNTTIAAAGAGMLAFLLRFASCGKYDIGMFCNGILSGLVSIAAGCSTVESGSALAIGVIGGLMYTATSILLKYRTVDDPVDAFATYGVPGMWGVVAALLFEWGEGFSKVHGRNGFRCIAQPLGCLGEVDALGLDLAAANFSLIGVVILWVTVLSAIIFGVLKVSSCLMIPDESTGAPVDEAAPGERPQDGYKYEGVYGNSSI